MLFTIGRQAHCDAKSSSKFILKKQK